MRPECSPSAAVILLALLMPGAAGAHGAGDRPALTPVDYDKAAALLPSSLASKLRNANVIPHWIDGRDRFWYRRETPTGHEFIEVDAATGRKRPAFDHEAVAAALSRASGSPADARQLPFDSIEFADRAKTLRFNVGEQQYVCELRASRCDRARDRAVGPGVLVSPDGRFGVLTREGNLWLRDLDTGTERALTSDGEADFGYGIWHDAWKAAFIPRRRAGKPLPPLESYWSPDSRRVVVPRIDQRHVEPYPFVESAPHDGSFRPRLHSIRLPLVGERPASLEWFVFEIPTGERRRIDYPYDRLLSMQSDLMAIRKTWWSGDNRHLYAVAFGDNMESAWFFDADLVTGAVRTVIEEHAVPRADLNSTSYNPPNVRIVRGGKEVIWYSQRDGWGHLYLYDVATGRLKNRITQGNWLVRDILHVDEARRRVYFTGGGRESGNPYYRHLYRADLDGSGVQLLSPEPGDLLLTSPSNDVLAMDGAQGYQPVSPSGAYVVYNHAPIDVPTQSVIRATDSGRLVAVFEEADATGLFAAGFRPPEEFVVKAADGETDLYGVVYWPSNFDPSNRYPVIDAQYASPLTAVVPRNFVQALNGVKAAPALAALGFVVVVVDARGTTYRSRDFSQWGFGQLNTMGLEDHIAALRQLAIRIPAIDLDRVGIIGGSFGGWSTLRGMLEFPEFFKVGVAGVPVGSMHNMYADYHLSAFHGRPEYSDGSEFRTAPTEVPRNWMNVDSRQQAARLAGKLLIVMGELDENVLPGSTLQLVKSFIEENRDFELIYVPDANHFEVWTPYVTRRIWDFLVRHLQGAEPPREYQLKELHR